MSKPLRNYETNNIIYQCSFCCYQANYRKTLKRHLRSCIKKSSKTHEDPKRIVITSGAVFKCEYCFCLTNSLDKLIKHKKTHQDLINLGLIECSHCNLNFLTIGEFKKHMINSSLHPVVEFSRVNDDASPLSLDDNENDDENCSDQEPKINIDPETEKLPLAVEDVDHGVGKINGFYSCPCKKFQTKYLSAYLHHLIVVHKAMANKGNPSNKLEANVLTCIICSREASTQLQLVLHMALEHVKAGSLFTCPEPGCSFGALQREVLKLHLIDVHRLEGNDFGQLTDNFSLTCSQCSYGTESKTLLRAHELYSHPEKWHCPLQCPWPECEVQVLYKPSLKRHLLTFHGINLEVTYIHEQGWVIKGNLLTCSSCNAQTQTELQMMMHKIFGHSKNQFVCPTPRCLFVTERKFDLKRHLMQEHELDEEYFRNYEAINPFDLKESEKHNDAMENLPVECIISLELPDEIEYEYKDVPCVSLNHNKRYNCDVCQFSTDYKISARKHQKHIHGKQRCDACKQFLHGKYALFWHQTFVHRFVVNTDEWGLICNLCYEEFSPENCYEHGSIHKCDTVTFQTLYRDVPTGLIVFQYDDKKRKSRKVVSDHTNKEKEEIEGCSAPSAIKVLDWTMSDNGENVSGTLAQLKKADAVTIEFAESDNESSNSNLSVGTDNLLVMKSEFLACKECSYEAKNTSVLNSHVLLMHAGKVEQYQCPEDGCEFCAKYAGNFKRHLINAHKLTLADLFGTDEKGVATTIKKKIYEKGANVSGKNPKMTYAWKRYKDEHQLDSDPEWEPVKDLEHQDSKQKFQCPEKRCSFSTSKKSELLRHHHEKHNISKFSKTRYFCPNRHCIYTVDRKSQLKNHLEVFHEIEKHKISTMEKTILSMKKIICSLCNYQTKDSESFKTHLQNKHKSYILKGGATNSDEKILDAQSKWRLKCVMCPYETSSKRAAYKHGYQHYCADRTIIAVFYKLYKNQQQGLLKFRYSSKNRHRCSKCPYIGLTTAHLLKHHLRHHKTGQKLKRKTHPIKKEIETKSDACKQLINEEIMSNDILIKNEATSSSQKKEVGKRGRRKKAIVATEKTDPQELVPHIIEITSEKPSNTDEPTDSELGKDKEHKSAKQNEIIRIEVIEDADDNELKLDPLTGSLTSSNNSDELGEGKFPCSMCELVAPDKQLLKIHAINEHLANASQQKKTSGKITFKCCMCGKSLVNEKTLENHTYMHARLKDNFAIKVKYSKFKGKALVDTIVVKANPNYIPRKRRANLGYNPNLSAHIPGRTSFKCWMCGETFFNKVTLDNHTYIHAREEDNFNIKVRYSLFKGDTKVDTIIIKADPNYAPRQKRPYRERSPALDYDPDLPVFGCKECNFKTNEQAALIKHKGLHWSSEKEAAFKAQKWYTCGVCFFHCFDVVKFKEHGEKHRERNVPGAKIDVEKIAKNSWSF